jgi:hypothetical protein
LAGALGDFEYSAALLANNLAAVANLGFDFGDFTLEFGD